MTGKFPCHLNPSADGERSLQSNRFLSVDKDGEAICIISIILSDSSEILYFPLLIFRENLSNPVWFWLVQVRNYNSSTEILIDPSCLVLAERIDTIYNWLKKERLDDQFHPSYTRMTPAHHIFRYLSLAAHHSDCVILSLVLHTYL